jgi:hypothetical protein
VLIASILMLLAGPAVSAWGDAKVRFVQAIPGSGAIQLQASEGGIDQRIGRPLGYGKIGSYEDVPAGEVELELLDAHEAAISSTRERVRNGVRYTVVAMRDRRPVVLEDGGADGGRSSLRVVQAAPELGKVDVRLGDEAVAEGVGFGDVAPYTAVAPGAYALQVTSPKDGSMISSRGAVTLTAGTSSTAFVIGTGGEPVETVVAADRAAAPRGAPATGLGGLAGEDPQLLIALLAGLLGALAGAAIYLALTARSRRGG